MATKQQPTVKEINNHTFAGTGVCVVYVDGFQMRISRARTNKGVVEGRVITFSYSGRNASNVGPMKDWQAIPVDATVELN